MRRAGRRSSSSSGTPPAGSTTTFGSSATARSRAGLSRRAFRSTAARADSRSTSRIIPLSYATFEGEIPKGEYGAGTVEIWDRGTYELLEEKRDGGLTFRLHGERLQGVWTLVPAALDGDERNWLLLRKDDDAPASAERPATSRCSRRWPRSFRGGKGWLYEVKWDGYRTICTRARGGGDAHEPHGQGPDGRPLRARRQVRFHGRSADRTASSTARSAHSMGRAGRASPRCSRAPARLSSTSSTCSSSTASRVLDRPFTERHELLRELVVPDQATVRAVRGLRGRRGVVRRRGRQGLEGIVAKRASSTYQPGKRSKRLGEGEGAIVVRSS